MKKALPQDIPTLVAMMSEFYAEGGYSLNHKHATNAFAMLLSDDRQGHIGIIQAGETDVGYVVVTFCFGMEFGGLCAFVDDLYVRSAFRRRGLAAAALTEVCAGCISRGIRAIHVETGHENIPAQALYRHIGFAHVDRLHLTRQLSNPTHDD